jgi:hydrogenase maturation protease
MTKASQATREAKGKIKNSKRTGLAVVGVGNLLLKDEGIGIHVIRTLRQTIRPDSTDVRIIDGGTSPDTFLLLEGVKKLIIVDAVNGGSAPGSVYRFHPDDIPATGKCLTSLHQIDVLDGLRMMELSGIKPEETVIIGIEPQEINWGLELSAELSQRLPQIVRAVMDELGSP